MKAIKYLAVGAFLVALSAPVYAQTANETAINQVEQILNSQAADADKQIDKIAKSYKKDAATLTGIGRMYYYAKNYDRALVYADKAKTASKFKYGGAYVLSGDIAAAQDNGGQAAEDYQQAQYLDPKNPDGYVRYAYLMRKSGLNASLQVLETLKQNNPDYDINLTAAEICKSVDNKDKAFEYLKKADKSKMTEKQLYDYAYDLYLSNRTDDSFEVVQEALKYHPRNSQMNRLAFYICINKKNYDKALEYADNLFNNTDNFSPVAKDYQNMALALEQTKQNDKAIEVYKQILAIEDLQETAKNQALKGVASNYLAKEDYTNAVEAYKEVVANATNANANDYNSLAYSQMQIAKAAEEADQQALWGEVDNTYAAMGEKFENAKAYCLYQRGLNATNYTKDYTAAKQYFDEYIDLVFDTDKMEAEKSHLTYALQCNISFCKDQAQKVAYAKKLQQIDPEDKYAKAVLK